MDESGKIKIKAEFLLLFVSINWGISFPIIKILLQYCSPEAVVFYRFAITLLLFLILYPKIFTKVKFTDLKYGLILGGFVFGGFITQTIGLSITTSQKSAFITGTYVVLLPFAQYLIIKKAPKKENIVGVIMVMIGLFFLTQIKEANFNIGDFLTLICAVFFTVHIVYLDKFLNEKKADYRALVLGQFLVMTIAGFLSMTLVEVIITKTYFFEINTTSVFSILYISVVCTLLGWLIINNYQRYTTPVKAGIIYSMEVVFAVFSAYLIINESLELDQIMGAILMLTGMAVSEFYGYIKKSKVTL
ncbi:MAG: DMT family transporter [Ignavibacteriae bacterium]|nr:DMT family transporter [Ignavibacteriota bacterium]